MVVFQAQQETGPPPIDESTPWLAASDGNLTLLQSSLTELNLSPNAADSHGFTLLHAACGYSRVEVIEWLLGLNGKDGSSSIVIDVNARDEDGDTPLHHCDDVVAAKLVVKAGADNQIRNQDDRTALEMKEEELMEGENEEESDDKDREKLKELVKYLRSLEQLQ